MIKIALAGNPNCGKTTLFNGLTGSNQFVGNWPGVTVEKKEGNLKKLLQETILSMKDLMQSSILLMVLTLKETYIYQLRLWNLVFQ